MKCEMKIQKSLDILNILRKLEESHTMIKVLKNQYNKSLLKFSGQKVIKFSSSSDSSSCNGTSDSSLKNNLIHKHKDRFHIMVEQA
jgi:hypothetical protein